MLSEKIIQSNFNENGFTKLNTSNLNLNKWYNFFSNYKNVDKAPLISSQGNGYSSLIDPNWIPEIKNLCINFANKFINFYPEDSILNPRIVGFHLLKSTYSREFSNNNIATGGYLWHRDPDDLFYPQLKIMIPLTPTSSENGMLSIASKKICSIQERLVDKVNDPSLQDFITEDDSKYRIRDKVMRNNFSNYIFDFKAKVGEALILDSSLCYHKGGMVLNKGRYRINAQVTIGSCLHYWNDSKKIIRSIIRKIILRGGSYTNFIFPHAFKYYNRSLYSNQKELFLNHLN